MVIRKGIYALISLMSLPILSWSIELQPWIGNYLEFEWRNTMWYQTYTEVRRSSHVTPYASDDVFFKTSLSNAVKPEFSIEAEGILAHTTRQRANVDCLRLAGRYVWFDDLLGDSFTFTTTGVFTQAFAYSLKDISSFHHGKSEFQLFASIGQETSLEESWQSRWWAALGIGAAERGSPWWQGRFSYHYRFFPRQEVQLFMDLLWGSGHKTLNPYNFHGYGPIRHGSVDLGVRYIHSIPFFGSFQFEYTHRPYAYNFPASIHRFLVEIFYSFGI